MAGCHGHELLMHEDALGDARDGTVGGKLLDRLAHLHRRGVWRHRFAEGDRHRVGDFLRPLPEELPALMTEDASPHVVQTNRNNRRRATLDNLLETAIEGHHKPGARDAAFREDAHHLAVGQRVARRVERPNNRARPRRAIYRNYPGEL